MTTWFIVLYSVVEVSLMSGEGTVNKLGAVVVSSGTGKQVLTVPMDIVINLIHYSNFKQMDCKQNAHFQMKLIIEIELKYVLGFA